MLVECENCQGSGGGDEPATLCPVCHGKGQVAITDDWPGEDLIDDTRQRDFDKLENLP